MENGSQRMIVRRPGAGGITGGLDAFGGGIGFVVGTPSVWGYAVVPVAMMVLLACGLSGAFIFGAYKGLLGDLTESVDAASLWVRWLIVIGLSLAGFVLAALLALCLAQPLSGFALERI